MMKWTHHKKSMKTKKPSREDTKKDGQDKAQQQKHHGTQTSVTDDNYKNHINQQI